MPTDEEIAAVEKEVRNTVFQTGGKHGLVWQIVWMWSGPEYADQTLFVGREMRDGESIKKPPAEMYYEMLRCKAMVAIEAIDRFRALGQTTP